MVRVLSALVLLPVVLAAIWFLTSIQLLLVVEAVLVLAFAEYARLAAAMGARLPKAAAGAAAVTTCAVLAWPGAPVEVPLMAAVIALAALVLAMRQPGPTVLAEVSASVFGAVYLGLPLGALVAIHATVGREAVLLLLFTVIASDTAQYYTGRLAGRRLLAPAISPKKTIEGAIGGFAGGMALVAILGRWWLPAVPVGWRLALGAILVGLGIIGDLFESLLKRSAGVKDSSGLIPGHGGMLDRIDALLFAAPAYYVFLRYGVFATATGN